MESSAKTLYLLFFICITVDVQSRPTEYERLDHAVAENLRNSPDRTIIPSEYERLLTVLVKLLLDETFEKHGIRKINDFPKQDGNYYPSKTAFHYDNYNLRAQPNSQTDNIKRYLKKKSQPNRFGKFSLIKSGSHTDPTSESRFLIL